MLGKGDEVLVSLTNTKEIRLVKIHGDGGKLPLDANKNTATVAIDALCRAKNITQGFEIELFKNLPIGSGLGSSATSAAAAVWAANELLGRPCTTEELVPFVMQSEHVVCGARHGDNAAPSLLGGLVLIRSYAPLDLIRIDPPKNFWLTFVKPDQELRTADARRVLNREVPLTTAVAHWANVGGLIAGLLRGDIQLIARSIEDHIVEPKRAPLIAGYEQVKKEAQAAGALAVNISGGGPAIFAVSDNLRDAERLQHVMIKAFTAQNIASEGFTCTIDPQGARQVP